MMAQSKNDHRRQPDLNKPLPLSPQASTSSLSSVSSKSQYSTEAAGEPASSKGHDTYYVPIDTTALPNSKVPSVTFNNSDITASSDCILQASRSSLAMFDRVQIPTRQTGTGDSQRTFKSLSYDQVSKTPNDSYAKALSLGAAKSQRRTGKFQLGSILKQRRSKVGTDVTQSRNDSGSCSSIRPPRPPRHLCPSPPYNPANMPKWCADDHSYDVLDHPKNKSMAREKAQYVSRTIHGSTLAGYTKTMQRRFDLLPNRIKFANQHDLELRKHGHTYHQARHDATIHHHRLPRSRSPVLTANRHSASSYIQMLDTGKYDLMNETNIRNVSFDHSTYSQCPQRHLQDRLGTLNKLDRVPEDTSIRSFSTRQLQDIESEDGDNHYRPDKATCIESEHFTPSLAAPIAHSHGMIQEGSRSLDDIDSEAYHRGRERVRAVSDRLRTQYREEWDRCYGPKPQYGDVSTKTFPESKPTTTDNQNMPDHGQDQRSLHSSAVNESSDLYSDIVVDEEHPRVSRLMARLAELCKESETELRTSIYEPSITDASESENDCVAMDLSNLVPAALQPKDSIPSREGVHASTCDEHKITEQEYWHHQDSSSSISPTSTRFRERIFTGSTFEHSFVDSPVTEPSDWADEFKICPTSPLTHSSPQVPIKKYLKPPYVQISYLPQHQLSDSDLRSARSICSLSGQFACDSDPKAQESPSIQPTTSSIEDKSGNRKHDFETTSVDDMFYHQNRAQGPFRFRVEETDLGPPPIPERSPLRALAQRSKPQSKSATATTTSFTSTVDDKQAGDSSDTAVKAELNGELPPPAYVFGSTRRRLDSKNWNTTYAQRERDSVMTKEIGPFHQVSYRGKSVLYHVNAIGESTF